MEFAGFPTVAAFKHACTQLGYTVNRKIIHRNGDEYVLLTLPPRGGSAIGTWIVFNCNETAGICSGIIPNAEWLERAGGVDRNFIGVLKKHGFSIREAMSE